MKRTDLVVTTVVLAAVVAVAALRTSRERQAPAAATAGPAQVQSEARATAPIPRMVDIGARECIPCRRMAPILSDLRAEYAGRADVVFIDVWERPELARDYVFRAIPTQIFYDREGREVWRHEGFLDKPEIVARFRRLGVQ